VSVAVRDGSGKSIADATREIDVTVRPNHTTLAWTRAAPAPRKREGAARIGPKEQSP
jgi:hypothetical protein